MAQRGPTLLWLSVLLPENFHRDTQKLTLESNKLVKPTPWKVGTLRIKVIKVLPNKVNSEFLAQTTGDWAALGI